MQIREKGGIVRRARARARLHRASRWGGGSECDGTGIPTSFMALRTAGLHVAVQRESLAHVRI
jgi:hypothetical protein